MDKTIQTPQWRGNAALVSAGIGGRGASLRRIGFHLLGPPASTIGRGTLVGRPGGWTATIARRRGRRVMMRRRLRKVRRPRSVVEGGGASYLVLGSWCMHWSPEQMCGQLGGHAFPIDPDSRAARDDLCRDLCAARAR